MAGETFIEKQEESISVQIFAVSSNLIGACFAALGLVSIFQTLNSIAGIIDDVIVFIAVLFITACVLSYTAIKTKDRAKKLRLEKSADVVFLSGLAGIIVTCVLFVFGIR